MWSNINMHQFWARGSNICIMTNINMHQFWARGSNICMDEY